MGVVAKGGTMKGTGLPLAYTCGGGRGGGEGRRGRGGEERRGGEGINTAYN